jgi:hypothetical protein
MLLPLRDLGHPPAVCHGLYTRTLSVSCPSNIQETQGVSPRAVRAQSGDLQARSCTKDSRTYSAHCTYAWVFSTEGAVGGRGRCSSGFIPGWGHLLLPNMGDLRPQRTTGHEPRLPDGLLGDLGSLMIPSVTAAAAPHRHRGVCARPSVNAWPMFPARAYLPITLGVPPSPLLYLAVGQSLLA